MKKSEITIFDLDGTLADASWRLPMIKNIHGKEKFKKQWGAFFAGIPDDPPIKEMVEKALSLTPNICFLTGRPEKTRIWTERWLTLRGFNMEEISLYMRPANDFREDTIIKEEIYLNIIEPKHKVLMVYDDKPSIIEMFNSHGVPTTKVGNWERFA